MNKVTDALSWRVSLIAIMHYTFIGFEHLKDKYREDLDFKDIWENCLMGNQTREFHI